MIAKKGFKTNPALAFISSANEEEETQQVHEEQEVHNTQEVQQEQRTLSVHGTQGRKGQKLPRINMAFSTANLEYLQIISRIKGISATEYVNRMLDAEREAQSEIIEAAKKRFEGGKK